ncbi:MAG: DNA-binding response regulator [Ignavibacteriales bacterium]
MKEIWIIEDNASYSAMIRSIIDASKNFFCGKEFICAEDALKELSRNSSPDVILTDINLPGISGTEGIKKIKAISGDVEIIVLTVFDDNEKIFEAICNGANGYLLKNSAPEDILSAIESVIDGGSSINAGLARKVFTMFASMKQKENSYGLTKRENEILNYLVDGKTAPEIGKITFTSVQTVQTHIKNIYTKVQVNTRSGLVSKALKEGLVQKK